MSHLQETHVQRLEREICSSFTGNSFELDITSGQSHLTIRLQATEFVPSSMNHSVFPSFLQGL